MVEPLKVKLFGILEDIFLTVIIDFISFQIFLMLSILALKYWLQKFFLKSVDNKKIR